MKVLFVCTGNTCRSPMAEGILRHMAENQGLDIEVKSAGIAVYNNDFAADNSIDVMKAINIDISHHRSRQADKDLIEESDLILTMSQGHKDAILSSLPRARVFNLLEYAYGVDGDVSDPFGGSLDEYEEIRDEIYEAILRLVDKL